MIFRPASFRSSLALSAMALAVALASAWNSSGADRPRGRSIEFSDSKGEIGTNLNQLGKSDRLKNLEQDLFKPFQAFSPKSSLDGVFIPPPSMQKPSSPAIQSKRVRELMERRKNWTFMTAEELSEGPSDNDLFGIPDLDENGQEKKKESAIDRFYRKLDGKRNKDDDEGEDSKTAKRIKTLEDLDENDEDHDLPKGLRESEQALKKMADKEKPGQVLAPLMAPNLLTDIFGTKEKASSSIAPERPAAKPWMKEFQEMTMPNATPGTASLQPISTLDFRSPAASPSAFDSQPVRLPAITPASTPPSLLGTINSPLVPSLPDAMRPSAALPSLNFTPRIDPPRVEPVRAPTSPLLAPPQRKF